MNVSRVLAFARTVSKQLCIGAPDVGRIRAANPIIPKRHQIRVDHHGNGVHLTGLLTGEWTKQTLSSCAESRRRKEADPVRSTD